MRYRDLILMQRPNDGSRSLNESIMLPEVIRALRDWTRAGTGGIIIGGVALSYYVKPRMTQDIDVMLLSDDEIPASVTGFKKTRDHAFQHNLTHVEVEIATPEHVGYSKTIFEHVRFTSVESNGVKIASASGLVALKLGRANAQDRADIIALIKTGRVDLDGFSLAPLLLAKFEQLVEEAASDPS